METPVNKIYSHSAWIRSQMICKQGKKKRDEYHHIVYLQNKHIDEINHLTCSVSQHKSSVEVKEDSVVLIAELQQFSELECERKKCMLRCCLTSS